MDLQDRVASTTELKVVDESTDFAARTVRNGDAGETLVEDLLHKDVGISIAAANGTANRNGEYEPFPLTHEARHARHEEVL